MSAKPNNTANTTANNTDENNTNSAPALNELEQLRQIVFGAAQKSLEDRINAVNSELKAAIIEVREQQIKQFSELHTQIETSLSALDSKLQGVDSHHENNHNAMIKANEILNSQLEMAESSGKDDTDALHDRIDKEIAGVSATFESKYADAMKALEKVTHELTDTKTDRKTLARLLATLATNLETD